MTGKSLLLAEDFDGLPDGSPPPSDWWVEGGESVRVESGRLRVKANPSDAKAPGCVCTVWNRTVLSGSLRVDFDACVVESTIDANNINLFLYYADPSGKPLHDTRASRASGEYGLYHRLNGYIFTFLNDTERPDRARFRIRRCPGFRLLAETFGYHCRRGVVYHVAVAAREGIITYAVDGEVRLAARDPSPWSSGLLGLRTYQTDLWWDNIRVTSLDA